MPVFYEQRKINTDAVAQMSMDNYYDIRNPKFILRKQVERELMHRYANQYISKHVLVMFTNTPYAQAMAQGEVQAILLDQICYSINDIKEVNWQKVDRLMNDYDKKLANIGKQKIGH
jgi:kynurenine 3-monooxygenase